MSKINYKIHTSAVRTQCDRLVKLNKIAIQQMMILEEVETKRILTDEK